MLLNLMWLGRFVLRLELKSFKKFKYIQLHSEVHPWLSRRNVKAVCIVYMFVCRYPNKLLRQYFSSAGPFAPIKMFWRNIMF